MSNITATNINGNYPIAGQDNNSQGFRDNFTLIKTNLTTAAAEITDLQNKAIVKTALDGVTINNDFNYTVVKKPQISGLVETLVALGNKADSVDISFIAGHVQTLTTTNSITLNFTNVPAIATTGNSKVVAKMRIIATIGNVAHTVTLPSTVVTTTFNSTHITAGGGGTKIITFPEAATYILDFSIVNEASNVIYLDDITLPENSFRDVSVSGRQFVTSTSPVLDATAVTPPTAIPLTNSTSLFVSGGGAFNLTLAGSVGGAKEGQIKYLGFKTDGGGDVVVTVTDASWTTGTITFNSIGDACTLLYTDGKWYCVGESGVSFV